MRLEIFSCFYVKKCGEVAAPCIELHFHSGRRVMEIIQIFVEFRVCGQNAWLSFCEDCVLLTLDHVHNDADSEWAAAPHSCIGGSVE